MFVASHARTRPLIGVLLGLQMELIQLDDGVSTDLGLQQAMAHSL